MDVERLVRDEQEGHVVVLGRAVLHLHPLGKPHETAWAEGTGVRLQNAVEDILPCAQSTGKNLGQVDVGVANRFATPALYGADVIIPTLAGIAVVRTS